LFSTRGARSNSTGGGETFIEDGTVLCDIGVVYN